MSSRPPIAVVDLLPTQRGGEPFHAAPRRACLRNGDPRTIPSDCGAPSRACMCRARSPDGSAWPARSERLHSGPFVSPPVSLDPLPPPACSLTTGRLRAWFVEAVARKAPGSHGDRPGLMPNPERRVGTSSRPRPASPGYNGRRGTFCYYRLYYNSNLSPSSSVGPPPSRRGAST